MTPGVLLFVLTLLKRFFCWSRLPVLLVCTCGFNATAAAADMRLMMAIEPPTNYLDDLDQPVGIAVDIVEELRRTLGVDAQIEVYPWARALKLAESNRDVVLFTDTKTRERVAKGFHFIGPLVTRRHAIYARSGNVQPLRNLAEVAAANALVVGMRGDWRTQLLKRAGATVEETPHHKGSLRMLLAGRAEFWLSSDLERPMMLRSIGENPDVVDEALVIREASSYLLISRGTDPYRIKAWTEAFSDLQTSGFFDRLANKWSSKLGVRYAYSRGKGVHLLADTRSWRGQYTYCAAC